MAKYADAILIIDDLMPATNKNRQNQVDDKFDNISRASGDRTTKKRMTDFSPNSTKTEYPVRGCCAITGEQVHGVQSAESRTVVVKLQKNDVINEKLRFFQDNYQLLPTHLVDFIEFVAVHYDYIISFIHEKLPFYRQMLTVKTPRLAEAFAVLMVTKDILFAYIRERGFMNESDLSMLNEHLFESVKTVILSNDRENAIKDPGLLCLTALSDAITTKTAHVVNRHLYREKDDVILEDETCFFVRTETMYLIAKNFCAKYDTPIALVNPKAVIPALEPTGVLDFTKERSRKLPDNSFDSRRYLYIKKDVMKQILERAEEEVI